MKKGLPMESFFRCLIQITEQPHKHKSKNQMLKTPNTPYTNCTYYDRVIT